MKINYILISISLIWNLGFGQIISYFDWNSNPASAANIGPNATSISGSAVTSTGGVGGTNGLNAGLPKADINMVLATGGGIFDVAGIDVSIDFQRDESTGNLFTRGSSLNIAGGANLSVTYRVDNGAGGFNTVSSGNVYAIPNDDTFRNYRFVYLPTTGVGRLYVNGASVWFNDGPDNRGMYWTGSGNITIGSALDGSGSNKTFIDNLIIGEVTTFPLPVELLSFSATQQNDKTVKLEWETASEKNNNFFSCQRSANATIWETIGEVKGAGNSTERLKYDYTDKYPIKETTYYRIQQTDFDGSLSYSPIKAVNVSETIEQEFNIYPNPSRHEITIEGNAISFDKIKIYNSLGNDVSALCVFDLKNEKTLHINLSNLHQGVYIVKTAKSKQTIIKE
jgi:hypothetical protein